MKLSFLLALLCAGTSLRAMGFLPSPAQRAVWTASEDFHAGDLSAAASALEPWVTRSAQAAREDLALRFLAQDYPGVLALDHALPSAAGDDEARLWVARADADLARWDDCLARLGGLQDPDRPWALCLRAEALAGLGDPAAAAAFGRALSATAGTRLEAQTALLAGENAALRGDAADEEVFYLRAQRADPSYTQVDARLAELYLCQERWPDARLKLEKVLRMDPGAQEARGDLEALFAQEPSQRRAAQQDFEERLANFWARSNPRVVPLSLRTGEPRVRVGLITGADAVRFRLGGAMRDSALGLTLAAGSAWVACAGQGGNWTLAPLDGNPAAARVESGPLRLSPLDPASTFGIFRVEYGAGYFFAGSSDRYYRGLLEISGRPGGLLVVNELGLEAYLLGVVPAEMPASWSPAALRAQAVAARTYAWAAVGGPITPDYDLYPTVSCQVYSGAGVETSRSDAAVLATAGEVLQDGQDRLSSAHFMDDSGGHTLAAGEVWPGPDPDSVGVADCPPGAKATATLWHFPLSPAGLLWFLDDTDGAVQGWHAHEGASFWRWTLRLSPEALAPSVDRYGAVGLPRAVLGQARGDGGYLESVRVVGDSGDFTVAGDRVRSALKGLKSNLFYVETRFDVRGRVEALLFHGGGWGHGVGMSQSGAQAMAQAGLDERAILRHYFPKDGIHDRYFR